MASAQPLSPPPLRRLPTASGPNRSNATPPVTAIRCSSPHTPAPPLQERLLARRSILASLLLVHGLASCSDRAAATSFMDKYVKRKKLEPLESYVPAVLLTQVQFKDLEKSFGIEKPDFQSSRFLLRSGPAASLRVNIRAVAQYAADDGKGKTASDAVDQCLRALEDLDSLLLHASRKDPSATVETMRSKINVAVGALDSLLQTVPAAILDKGKVIAEAYQMPTDADEENDAKVDKDLKELEANL